MNGLNFGESPNLRNAPWSAYRDEPRDFDEPTRAEEARELFIDMVRMAREDARNAFCQGGMTMAELEEVEAFALRWGVK